MTETNLKQINTTYCTNMMFVKEKGVPTVHQYKNGTNSPSIIIFEFFFLF